MKRIEMLKYSLVLLLALSWTGLSAQDSDKIEKTYKWNYRLDAEGLLELNNYDCDISINTWDKEEVMLALHVVADMKTKSNASALDKYLNDLDFENSPSRVSLDTKFWNSRIQIATRKVIKLDKGLKLTYSSFKVKAEIWMPGSADLDLKSKYSRIDLDKLAGELTLNLYNDKLYGISVEKSTGIIARYSTIEFDKCKDIKAEMYETDFSINEMEDLEINSKYSKIYAGNALSQTIDSYSDKYTYKSCGDINMVAKYTDLTTIKAGKVKTETYEGSVDIGDCLNMEIISKYTDFNMESARDIYISSIYEGSLSSTSVSSVSISESKYVKYKLGLLESRFELRDGYEDDIFIDKLSSYFKAIELNGKYLKCETLYNKDLDLKFLAKIKYPHLDTENIDLETKIKIKESSDIEYEAYKGEERPGMPQISLTGYEIRFSFK